MIDYEKTGAYLAKLRLDKGLSQQQLAKLMNVTHQAVSKWENGAALPDMQILLALSKLYHISIEDILLARPKEEEKIRSESKIPVSVPDGAAENIFIHETQEEENKGNIASKAQDEDENKGEEEAEIPDLDFETVSAMLPFMDSKAVDEVMLKAFKQENHSLLCACAPFASREGISSILTTEDGALPSLSRKTILALLPFADSNLADTIVLSALKNNDYALINSCAAFASKESVGIAFDAAAKNNDARCISLVPFTPRENIKKAFNEYDLDKKIKLSLAPFVPGSVIENLVQQGLRKMNGALQIVKDFGSGRTAPVKEHKNDRLIQRLKYALEHNDDELLDEYADELSAQELFDLLVFTLEQGYDSSAMLEYVDDDAVEEAIKIAAKAARNDIVLLLSEHL